MSDNPFNYFILTPSYGEGHLLQWALDPVFKADQDYTVTVEASGTQDFSELEYTLQPDNQPFVIDKTNFKHSQANDLFYRGKIETDGKVYYSRTAAFSASDSTRHQWQLAAEITRKELLRMRKYTGFQVWLLKRRIYGKAAGDNTVDPVSGVALTDQLDGLNTGYEVGYYKPLSIFISVEQSHSHKDFAPGGLGLLDVNQVSMRMVGFPIIETHDVIVHTPNDDRFVVKDTPASTCVPGTYLRVVQTFTAQMIPPTDPVYKIKMPDCLI